MKFLETQTLLEQYVLDNVAEPELRVFENVSVSTEHVNEWMRVSMQFGESELRALGSRCYRVPGILFFQIYTRPDIGSARAHKLADTIANLFKGRAIGSDPTVNFLAPSLAKLIPERTGWTQAQLACPFYYDLEE